MARWITAYSLLACSHYDPEMMSWIALQYLLVVQSVESSSSTLLPDYLPMICHDMFRNGDWIDTNVIRVILL